MGKKLSYSEKASRERQRERERIQKANDVASRRAAVKKIREKENEAIRVKNAKEVANRREADKKMKEAENEANIKFANAEAKRYDNFYFCLTNLHLTDALKNYSNFHKNFKNISPFDIETVKRPIKPIEPTKGEFIIPPFNFERQTFYPPYHTSIKKLESQVKYSFTEYCNNEGKLIFNKTTWIIFFILLFPLALLKYMSSRKKFGKHEDYHNYIANKKESLAELKNKTIIEEKEFVIKQEKLESEQLFIYNQNIEKRRIEHEKKYQDLIAKYHLNLINYNKETENYKIKISDSEKKHNENEKFKVEWYSQLLEGKMEIIEQMSELLFPIIFNLDDDFIESDPSNSDVGFKVVTENTFDLNISLPADLNFLPEYGIKLTPSGRDISEYIISQKVRNEANNMVICSIAFAYVKVVFEYCKTINFINIEISIPGVDKRTGEYKDEILLYLRVDKLSYNKLNYTNIDVIEALKNFEHDFKPTENKSKDIKKRINTDELLWSTEDDSSIKINPYIKKCFKEI